MKDVRITVNGETVDAAEGIPLGAVLHERDAVLRLTQGEARPRGIFCGMGVCFDCLVTVDGVANRRACMTMVRAGMVVETRK